MLCSEVGAHSILMQCAVCDLESTVLALYLTYRSLSNFWEFKKFCQHDLSSMAEMMSCCFGGKEEFISKTYSTR